MKRTKTLFWDFCKTKKKSQASEKSKRNSIWYIKCFQNFSSGNLQACCDPQVLTASVSPAAHLLPRLLLLLLGDREHRDFGHRLLFLLLGDGDHCDVVVMLSFLTGAVSPSSSSSHHITIYFSCLELLTNSHCILERRIIVACIFGKEGFLCQLF